MHPEIPESHSTHILDLYRSGLANILLFKESQSMRASTMEMQSTLHLMISGTMCLTAYIMKGQTEVQ